MKIKALVIEIGIPNINSLKNHLKPKNVELIYASSFLDVVDTIQMENVHIIVLSSFRGSKPTTGYIKMFKTTNENFKIIILSPKNKINLSSQSYYIQKGADSTISSHDIKEIENRMEQHYLKLIDKDKNDKWSGCTKKAIRFLRNNYSISSDLTKILSEKINFSASSIYHSVKKDTNKSLGDWLRDIRITEAKKLLKTTDMQVKLVGKHIGYRSVQGFIKTFKQSVGKNPQEYKRSATL